MYLCLAMYHYLDLIGYFMVLFGVNVWVLDGFCVYFAERELYLDKPYMRSNYGTLQSIPVSQTIMLEPCKLYLDLGYCRGTES